MPPFKAALAGFSTASALAVGFGVMLWLLLAANARADRAEEKAAAAVREQTQSEERRKFAEQQIGFAQVVTTDAIKKRLEAEAQVKGFAAELARVKKAAGKDSTVVVAGSGTSTPLDAGPGLFSKGDQGRFHLQLGGVKTEHDTLAVAAWAQAFNAGTNALLFEGSVPLTIDYTPPPPPPPPNRYRYGGHTSCTLVDSKTYCSVGGAFALKRWDLHWIDAQLAGGVGVWPYVNLALDLTFAGK